MRVSFITLCTFAACAAHDHGQFAQAQLPDTPPTPEDAALSPLAALADPLPLMALSPEDDARARFTPPVGSSATVSRQPNPGFGSLSPGGKAANLVTDQAIPAEAQVEPAQNRLAPSVHPRVGQAVPTDETLDRQSVLVIGQSAPSRQAAPTTEKGPDQTQAAEQLCNVPSAIAPLPVPSFSTQPKPTAMGEALPLPPIASQTFPSTEAATSATLASQCTTEDAAQRADETAEETAAVPIEVVPFEGDELPAVTSSRVPATTPAPTADRLQLTEAGVASGSPLVAMADVLPDDPEVTDIETAKFTETDAQQSAPASSDNRDDNTQPENTRSEPSITVPSPLERSPIRLLNLETANQLPADALQLSLGAHQTLSDDAPGTGNQLYYGTVDLGVTDDLQVTFSGQVYDDPPNQAINGRFSTITLLSLASSAKYRVVDTDNLDLGVQGSLELFSFFSPVFETDGLEARAAASLQAPVTYTVSPELQLHLTPGVSFLPEDFEGNEFYGTSFTVGSGVSWQPSERWLTYGTLNLPLGPGGNTIGTDGSIERDLVWTVGTRYNATPRVGVDAYVTNGLGITPATSILTSIPSAEDPLFGIRLNYTPDTGLGYRTSFRETAADPLSVRDRQLLVDGFTLATANTLEPQHGAVNATVGSNGNYGIGVSYSPDRDFQLEASIEDFGSDDSLDREDTAGDTLRYRLGARLRFLDQQQGDPVSLAARILAGRDTDNDRTLGVLFAEVPVTYQASSKAALFFNPRVAAFSGNDATVGLGFGANYEVAPGLQAIGEITPVFNGERAVWAVGTRYQLPTTDVSLDLYATNAIGRTGLGTLVGQSGARLGFNVNWILSR